MRNSVARLCLLLLLALTAPFALAQDDLDGVSVNVQSLERQLQVLTESLEDSRENDAELVQLGQRARTLAQRALAIGVELTPRIVDLRAQIDQLGPADTESEEPTALIQNREKLAEDRAMVNTLIGQLESISIRAHKLEGTASEARRALFSSRLSRRHDLVAAFGPDLIADLKDRYGDVVRSVGSWASFAWRTKSSQMIAATGLSFTVALVFSLLGRRLMGRFIRRDRMANDPPYMSKLTTAFLSTLLPVVSLLLFFLLVMFLYGAFDVLRGDIGLLMATLFLSAWVVFLVWRLAEVIFAPGLPAWRLVPVTDRAASLLKWLIVAMAIVIVLSEITQQVTVIVGSSLPITVAKSLIASVLVGLNLALIAFVRPFAGPEGEPDRRWPILVRILLFVLALTLIISAVAGYIGLASFLAEQLVITGAVVATMYLGYLAAHALSREKALGHTRFGKWLRVKMELSESRVDQIGLMLGILITLAILAVGLPLLFLFLGFNWVDIRGWILGALTEFSVGSISISITGILAGIVVFFVGFWLTKLFQRWLDGEVLVRGRVDSGVRNSIKTAVGYAGIALAALVGISAAGINMSQLALVAGGLSLGIGFGLQNIVSNFVSGLILLAERPIKVGDWIEAGGVSGNVKSINVRATEVETFQRKSVILPNSELINGPVSNWTHRNTLGRVEIPVGVSYKSDPKQVHDILMEIAADHPLILSNPEPFVVFGNFGDSSLDFELRGYLADITQMLTVSTDVRFAIFERFAAAGIEIPFPQRDVNLRMMGKEEVSLEDIADGAGFGEIETSGKQHGDD
jgi:potassium efflux system protein